MKTYNTDYGFIVFSDKEISNNDYVLRPNHYTINRVSSYLAWYGTNDISLIYARKYCKRISYIFRFKIHETN